MKHHFLPQYYLNEFTNQYGRIATIDIKTLKYFEANPKKVCAHNNLYRIGDTDHSYERHLGGLDGMTSKDFPKTEDKYILPKNIAAVLSLMSRITSYSPNAIELSHANDFYTDHPQYSCYKGLYELTKINAEFFAHYIEKLKQYSYLFVTSSDQEKFITSDNPVVHFFHIDKSEYFIFPINPTNILIGTACPLLFTIKDIITPPMINSLLLNKAKNVGGYNMMYCHRKLGPYVYMTDYQCEVDVGGYNMTFDEIKNKELSLLNLNRLWHKRYFNPKDMRHNSILLKST